MADPYPSLERARQEAPVFYDEQYGFWNVTRQEDVLAVLRDEARFSNQSAIPMPLPPEDLRDRMPVYPFETALLFMDDPEHRRNRMMVQAPFVPRRLKEREPVIRRRADELMSAAKVDGRMDFLSEFALPLALTVIGDLVGVPEPDWPLLERSVTGAFEVAKIASGLITDEARIRELAEEQADYWTYLCDLAEERRQRPTDDFSSVIAREVNQDDGSTLTAAEIAALINTMLGAGFHTSAQLMTSGIHTILSHRDQWELLKSDRSLLPSAVEECVRYRTSVKRIFRTVTADVEIGGVTVPEGALLALVLASSNRDESAYDDATRFDIRRTGTNLTFGRGMHHCLGASLSKAEMRITLETFLDHAPNARIVADQELERVPDVRLDTLEALHLDLT